MSTSMIKRILNWFNKEWRKLLSELDKTKKIIQDFSSRDERFKYAHSSSGSEKLINLKFI